MPWPDYKRQTKLLNQDTGRGLWWNRQTKLLYQGNCSPKSLFSRNDRGAGWVEAETPTLLTRNPNPWTLNSESWTLNSEPWTLNSEPWTLNSEPWTLGPKPRTLNPKPWSLNLQASPWPLRRWGYRRSSCLARWTPCPWRCDNRTSECNEPWIHWTLSPIP